MTKKTRYLGYDSGKSSDRWFREHPVTGDGRTSSSITSRLVNVVFRDKDGKKSK